MIRKRITDDKEVCRSGMELRVYEQNLPEILIRAREKTN